MKNTHTVAILRLVDPATTEISGTASKIGALSFTSLRFTYKRIIVLKINYTTKKFVKLQYIKLLTLLTVIVKGLEDFGLSSTNSRTKTWKLNRFSFGGSRSRLA